MSTGKHFKPQYIPGNLTVAGDLIVEGSIISNGIIKALRAETSDYDVAATDSTILADATSNTVTISLPAAPTQGQVYNIKCINATFTCTVDGNGNTIDGNASIILIQDEAITVHYDGTEWWII